jgi:hypothetical protein
MVNAEKGCSRIGFGLAHCPEPGAALTVRLNVVDPQNGGIRRRVKWTAPPVLSTQ